MPSHESGTSGRPGLRSILLIALVLALAGGAVAAALALGSGGAATNSSSCNGDDREIVVDLSSQNRSDDAVAAVSAVVSQAMVDAAVCEQALEVIGVAGGTQVAISPDVEVLRDLKGPNSRARSQHLRGHDDEITAAVDRELARVYAAYPEVSISSIPALFGAAADHLDVGAGTSVVILTTGVNIEGDVDLNRALVPGEGKQLAASITWPVLGDDVELTVVGIARMDGDAPAPGALWPAEVKAFVERACVAAGVDTCRLFQVADVAEVLS